MRRSHPASSIGFSRLILFGGFKGHRCVRVPFKASNRNKKSTLLGSRVFLPKVGSPCGRYTDIHSKTLTYLINVTTHGDVTANRPIGVTSLASVRPRRGGLCRQVL